MGCRVILAAEGRSSETLEVEIEDWLDDKMGWGRVDKRWKTLEGICCGRLGFSFFGGFGIWLVTFCIIPLLALSGS
jgi:hypothetical protein